MAGFSTVLTGLGLGSVIGQAMDQRRLQKRALNEQAAIQKQAMAAANREQRLNEMEYNKANQKTPDMAALLTNASKVAGAETSTMLTGSKGLDPLKMKLQRPSLLGEV